ncbi:MAG: BTAD domain-containing putative transcriptional regulator [Caldilineaceae bacterium]
MDEYYARRNLNRTLSDLTKVVGDHLMIERHSLALARTQPYWLDVEVLETALTLPPTAHNVATLAAAAELYRAEFLDGFYVQEAPVFEQWVLTERTRLRTGVLHLLHTLAHYHAEQGALLPAMDYARRILQLEPWREEAHRQLMLLLAQSGQRSAALAQYELCRQALRSELEVEPDTVTLDLVARIRAGSIDKGTSNKGTELVEVTEAPNHLVPLSPPQPVPLSRPHNLPAQRTPFIGRATELAAITRLLVEEEDCRLLTLIGPGGMGKTRLALKAAEQIGATPAPHLRFGDGICFVPLETVSDADGLVSAIMAALTVESGLPLHREAPLQEQLVHFLRPKAMLLVLDNFEHLVKHADLCSTLLVAAPQLKLLVTSRESLGLQEAWFYPLLGLTAPNPLPEQPGRYEEYDAVQLFAQCARRTHPGFRLEAEWAAVLRICMLVEGMPLGIELAATWLKVMTCAQIAKEITRSLDFLTARYQNIPARHRSMRAVMDHSWALLAADEAEAIARLAIFRGQFRQAAAGDHRDFALYAGDPGGESAGACIAGRILPVARVDPSIC